MQPFGFFAVSSSVDNRLRTTFSSLPQMADTEREQEALRLKSLSEANFKSGDISSAIKSAKKAQRLSPYLPGLSEMLTCFNILDAAACHQSASPDYYRILQVEPFSHINMIKKQYKKLALLLHPDKHCSLGSEEAFKVVGDAFRVLSDRIRRKEYDLKLRIRMQEAAVARPAADDVVETFWTACSHCKLLHQFERKYLRQNLVCPSCTKSFRAVEIGDEEVEDEKSRNGKRKATIVQAGDDLNGSDSSGDELTLAEMQLQATKKLRKVKINTNSKEQLTETNHLDAEAQDSYMGYEDQPLPLKVYSRRTWRTKNTIPERVITSSQQCSNTVFFDFVKDRVEKSFKKGQIWATYNKVDSMPRHYCLIEDVVSTNPFEVRVSWLSLHDKKKELDTACGRFRVSRKSTLRSVNLFSHIVNSDRVAREMYQIYPTKGSIWAMYGTDRDRYCYNIVICLTSYSEVYGLSMAYLEKVDGFRSVFRRQGIGAHAVRVLEQDRVNLCSHQVPAKKIVGKNIPSHLQGAWELDPTCLPLDSKVLPL